MYSRCINKVTLEFILISLILHKAAAYSGSCIVKSTVQSSNSVMKEFFNFQLGCKIPCLKSFDGSWRNTTENKRKKFYI